MRRDRRAREKRCQLCISDYGYSPEGLRIGHLHLRVGDLAQAEGFYRDAIGFDPTR